MIEIINPGLLSIIVDSGRYGFSGIGVPSSAALDIFAYNAVNYLTGGMNGSPVIESIGSNLSLRFDTDIMCAITGAKVSASVDDKPCPVWKSFRVRKGSVLKIKGFSGGFRYYIGVSGVLDIEKTIGSYSTNIECRFGGFKGRQLLKGDAINIKDVKIIDEKEIDKEVIPDFSLPHIIHVVDGPEIDFFTVDSIKRLFEKKDLSCYKVSAKSNKTGIRLEGKPLEFRKDIEKSIISEGILPGTIQISGDGLPIIMLNERTVGGYARVSVVARADRDMLAHLKPGDEVVFERITVEEAEDTWMKRQKAIEGILNA